MATASVGVLLRSPGGGTLCGARATGSLRCEHLSELSVQQGLSPWPPPPEGPRVGDRTQPERPPQERRTGSIPTTGAEMPPEPAWPKQTFCFHLTGTAGTSSEVCLYLELANFSLSTMAFLSSLPEGSQFPNHRWNIAPCLGMRSFNHWTAPPPHPAPNPCLPCLVSFVPSWTA